MVGAPGAGGIGEAIVYSFRSSLWNPSQTLTPSDPQAGEGFGSAVAMDSTDIVVGSPFWTNDPASPSSATEGGRAFIFELSSGTWIRMARLTAQDGLPASEAPLAGAKGEQFGAALSVSGNWVVVGAPQYQGTSTGQGEAYVFYRYTDPTTTLGPTWVRSTGGTGTGSIGENLPAGGDNFGAAVAVSGDLLVAGIPGVTQTGRLNVGAILTFQTNGIVPSAAQANLEAEIINPAGAGGSLVTFYDPTLRMLFVGNPTAGTVQVYVNEDLYWRPTAQGSLGGPSSFGTSIDEQGGHLAVGAPGVDTVYLYAQSGESWYPYQTYKGQSGSQFGASVAISGYKLVIGAPNAAVQYSSVGQASSGYSISLGNSGAAFVWDIRNGPSSNPTLLMPYDSLLPYNTTAYDPYYVAPISGFGPGEVAFRIYDGSTWWTVGNGPGTYNLLSYTSSQGGLGFNTVAVLLWPRTSVTVISLGGSLSISNYSYYGTYEVDFSGSNSWIRNAAVAFVSSALGPISTTPIDFNVFSGLAGTQWGSSVAIVGNTVVVGAPGVGTLRIEFEPDDGGLILGNPLVGRLAVYNLASSPDYHWSASAGGFGSSYPYIPAFTSDFPGSGAQLAFMDASHFFASTTTGLVIPYVLANGSWSEQTALSLSGVGRNDTLTASGGVVLAGSPGNDSGAGDAETSSGLTLLPYTLSGNSMVVVTSQAGFGYGPVIASSGDYLVGDASGVLYNFRQQGPGWMPLGTLVPNPPPTAKVGSSVAIDGMLTVIGAPQYDNRGAAFVFTIGNGSTPGTYTWTYDALLQSDDAREGDSFGASVGISGTTVIAGAPGRSGGAGAVYMFQEIGGHWVQVGGAIVPSDAGAGSRFGSSVAIDGSLALAGAPGRNAVYLIEGNGLSWTVAQEIDGTGGFGTSVSMSGQLAVVGAPQAIGGDGAAYAYSDLGRRRSHRAGRRPDGFERRIRRPLRPGGLGERRLRGSRRPGCGLQRGGGLRLPGFRRKLGPGAGAERCAESLQHRASQRLLRKRRGHFGPADRHRRAPA